MWHFMIRKKPRIKPTGPKLHKQFPVFKGDTIKVENFDHPPSETRAVMRDPIFLATVLTWFGRFSWTSQQICWARNAVHKKKGLFGHVNNQDITYAFCPLHPRLFELWNAYICPAPFKPPKKPSLQVVSSPRPAAPRKSIKHLAH